MKVLILGGSNSRNSGGIFNTNRLLGQSLQTYCNIDVQFLLYNDSHSSEDRKLYNQLPLHDYKIQWPKKLGYSKDMKKKMSMIKPDIVHSQGIWMYYSLVNRKYHLESGTPYIISTHGMLDHWQLRQSVWKNFKKKLALTLYEKKHLMGANCIQALCRSEYESIRNFGLKNPVAIIPNGTELPKRNYREMNSSIASRWQQKSNRKTLLFLSRIHPKKGLDNLLKAWKLTIPANHDWQLVISGDSSDKKYMQSLIHTAKKLLIEDTVQFIGGQYHENKQTCLIDADAFILPSFSEGLPLAVLEAWSFKLPVIMTSYCNLPEGFEKKAAIHIDTTVESIATGINKLISLNENDLKTLGENGHNLVNEKFTWEKIALATLDLYEWVIGKKEKPGFVIDE